MSPAILLATAFFAGIFGRSNSPPKCIPGQSVECACPDGRKGAQTCNDHGAFDPCLCERAGVNGAQPGPSQPCDPVGVWSFSGSPTDHKCKVKPLIETIIIAGENKKWVVGSTKQLPWNIQTLTVDGPVCQLRIAAQFETCPSCRPSEDAYNFLADLTASSGKIKGDVVVTHQPSYDDDEKGVASCVQQIKLHGKKRPMTDKQRDFDKVAAAKKFQKLCQVKAFENAFPWLEKHPKGNASRLRI